MKEIPNHLLEVNRNEPCNVGHVYVLRHDKDIAVEWLVVRMDRDSALVVPVDMFPLAGAWDLKLRNVVIRCSCANFFHLKLLEDPYLRVGKISDQELKLVRQRLADSARGRPLLVPNQDDFDPRYDEWIGELLLVADKIMFG